MLILHTEEAPNEPSDDFAECNTEADERRKPPLVGKNQVDDPREPQQAIRDDCKVVYPRRFEEQLVSQVRPLRVMVQERPIHNYVPETYCFSSVIFSQLARKGGHTSNTGAEHGSSHERSSVDVVGLIRPPKIHQCVVGHHRKVFGCIRKMREPTAGIMPTSKTLYETPVGWKSTDNTPHLEMVKGASGRLVPRIRV